MNAESQPATIFAQIVLILVLSHITVDADGCKKMILLPDKDGNYLRNHTVQTLATQSHSMCRVMCYLSDSCLSYNFQESTGTCDINDSDEFQHPDDMVSKSGYIYVGTENGCKSNPCPSNSTCQSSFTYEGGFTCSCPMGFTGSSCDKDIDECTSGTHNCSAHSTCQNTEGSFQCLAMGSKGLPAKSCLEIIKRGQSRGSGEYWLDPKSTGNPIQVFCDMTTDGGGWTKVTRLILTNSTIPLMKKIKTYLVIAEYNNRYNVISPSGQAMLDIKKVMGFYQIHFYCHKKSAGRVVSIMTKNNTAGQQVVRYFTDDASAAAQEFPDACGSFDRLPEDTSFLARNCALWGKIGNGTTNVNKWGSYDFRLGYRIVNKAFGIDGSREYGFGCYNNGNYKRCSCDDPYYSYGLLNVNDTWQISVR